MMPGIKWMLSVAQCSIITFQLGVGMKIIR